MPDIQVLQGLQTFRQRAHRGRHWLAVGAFADGAENKVFSVSFDPNGRVTSTATAIDPKDAGQAGR